MNGSVYCAPGLLSRKLAAGPLGPRFTRPPLFIIFAFFRPPLPGGGDEQTSLLCAGSFVAP